MSRLLYRMACRIDGSRGPAAIGVAMVTLSLAASRYVGVQAPDLG